MKTHPSLIFLGLNINKTLNWVSVNRVQEEESEDDVVDSDFDVDESAWAMEEEGEEQFEEKRKKKQWIKPKVSCR